MIIKIQQKEVQWLLIQVVVMGIVAMETVHNKDSHLCLLKWFSRGFGRRVKLWTNLGTI